MCPGIPVLARKDAEWNTFVRICLVNDVGDGTNSDLSSRSTNKRRANSYISKSTALSSVPSARASRTSKNLLLRTKTT